MLNFTLLCALLMSGQKPADLQVVVQPVWIADDNGDRPTEITPEQVEKWVKYADESYRPSGIRLSYDAKSGIPERRSTALNNITGTADADWIKTKRQGNALAAEFHGKLTVLFRHGPGRDPTGGGFGDIDYDFVAMPGFEATGRNIGLLAHEMGHYLGLVHTFPAEFPTVARAEAFLTEHHGDPACFDGDGLSDTLPDPFIQELQNSPVKEVVLLGKKFPLDRTNIMGYWQRDYSRLSPQQTAIVRWFMTRRHEHGMSLPSNNTARHPLEAENLRVVREKDAWVQVQEMDVFGIGTWSGRKQLLLYCQKGGGVVLALPVPRAGQYHLDLYLTMAPDYGQVRVSLDGKRLAQSLDCYAPRVIPTGRIRLGPVDLEPGQHTVTFELVGQNGASKGTLLGVDCLALE